MKNVESRQRSITKNWKYSRVSIQRTSIERSFLYNEIFYCTLTLKDIYMLFSLYITKVNFYITKFFYDLTFSPISSLALFYLKFEQNNQISAVNLTRLRPITSISHNKENVFIPYLWGRSDHIYMCYCLFKPVLKVMLNTMMMNPGAW